MSLRYPIPGSKLSRLAALFLFAVPVIMLISMLIIKVISLHQDAAKRIHDNQLIISKIEQQYEQEKQQQDQLISWHRYAETPRAGLSLHKSARLAEGEMQQQLATLFRTHKGRWDGAELLPAEYNNHSEVIRSSAQGILPESELPAFLREIETLKPNIFIDDLQIAQLKTKHTEGRKLHIRLRVSSYRISSTVTAQNSVSVE